jgi:hypothetical protein
MGDKCVVLVNNITVNVMTVMEFAKSLVVVTILILTVPHIIIMGNVIIKVAVTEQ